MKEKKNITSSELKILNLLWKSEKNISISELMTLLDEEDIHWAHTTIGTFLRRMKNKKIVASVKEGKTLYFYPIVTQHEVDINETKKYLDFNFRGSMIRFLSAFSKDNSLSKEDIDELRNWLEDMAEEPDDK